MTIAIDEIKKVKTPSMVTLRYGGEMDKTAVSAIYRAVKDLHRPVKSLSECCKNWTAAMDLAHMCVEPSYIRYVSLDSLKNLKRRGLVREFYENDFLKLQAEMLITREVRQVVRSMVEFDGMWLAFAHPVTGKKEKYPMKAKEENEKPVRLKL